MGQVQTYQLRAGAPSLDIRPGFVVRSLGIDNYTNQSLSIPILQRTVPANTSSVMIPHGDAGLIQVGFTSPFGYAAAAPLPGQTATIIAYEDEYPANAGQPVAPSVAVPPPAPPVTTPPALVKAGAIGAGTTGTAAPAFGQATTAGNLLVAQVAASGATAITCSDGTWTSAGQVVSGTGARAALFYKPNCGASEVAPTFTTSSVAIAAVLSEWSGAATATPLDQTGTATGTASPLAVTASGIDGGTGRLVICAYGWRTSGAVVASETDSTGFSQLVADSASRANHLGSPYSVTVTTGTSADTNTETESGGTVSSVAAVIASFHP